MEKMKESETRDGNGVDLGRIYPGPRPVLLEKNERERAGERITLAFHGR